MVKHAIRNSKHYFGLVLCLLFIVCNLVLGNWNLNVYAQDKIVAVVNNDIITQKDLNDFLNFMRMQMRQQYSGKELETRIQDMKVDLINKLIEDRLILQEAKKVGLIIDENRVKAKIDETKRYYPNETAFENALKQQGMIQADLETKIKDQFLMYSMIEYKIKSKIKVTPTEVTEFYQKHDNEFKLGEERTFDSINLHDETLARELYAALRKGKTMEEIANKYGLEVNRLSADKSGELKKEIEDSVFSLGIGEFSQPVNIEDRYYIFKLISITPPRQLSLEEARDNVYKYLINKKLEESLADWLEELKKHSYIKFIHD